jgi:hypothetical protein
VKLLWIVKTADEIALFDDTIRAISEDSLGQVFSVSVFVTAFGAHEATKYNSGSENDEEASHALLKGEVDSVSVGKYTISNTKSFTVTFAKPNIDKELAHFAKFCKEIEFNFFNHLVF